MDRRSEAVFGGVALGRQMTVEFYDCSSAVLADVAAMKEIFLRAADVSGAHVVDSIFHSFQPQGVSGVVVISESHFAVHAWPEHDYAAVDLFTCGPGVDFDLAVKALASGMESGFWIISSLVNRGILGEAGVERLVPVVENESSRGLQLSWKSRYERTGARAMSSCVDIYECEKLPDKDETVLRDFVFGIVEKLTARNRSGQYEWGCSERGDEVEFACSFDSGHVSGLLCRSKKSFYLDVFTDGFFEPREVAEFAVAELGGHYYRMQPQVRQ